MTDFALPSLNSPNATRSFKSRADFLEYRVKGAEKSSLEPDFPVDNISDCTIGSHIRFADPDLGTLCVGKLVQKTYSNDTLFVLLQFLDESTAVVKARFCEHAGSHAPISEESPDPY